MTVFELMERLTGIGASVSAEGDQVAVRFSEEHRRQVEGLGPEIRRLKPELLKKLNDASSDTLFDGLESRLDGERDRESKPPALEEVTAMLPPSVRVLRYEPKAVPFAVAPVSVVTNAGKFLRAYLKDLAWRLEHPDGYAAPPLADILAKLSDAGLDLISDEDVPF